MPDINDIQNIEGIDKVVLNIIGVASYQKLKTSITLSDKIGVLTDFITDSYSLYFEQEDAMENLAYDLEILTSFKDENYELIDDVIDAIHGINGIVEDEEYIDETIRYNIKVLLVYILGLLKNEPQEVNQIG